MALFRDVESLLAVYGMDCCSVLAIRIGDNQIPESVKVELESRGVAWAPWCHVGTVREVNLEAGTLKVSHSHIETNFVTVL